PRFPFPTLFRSRPGAASRRPRSPGPPRACGARRPAGPGRAGAGSRPCPSPWGRAASCVLPSRGPSGRSCALGLLLGELFADLVHVEVPDGGDHLLQRGCREGAGLGEDEDAVAEGHERGDRGDAGLCGQLGLGLGVHLAEDDVRVGLRGALVDGCEHAARAAPGRPPVDEDDAVLADGLAEGVGGEVDGGHVVPPVTWRIPLRVCQRRPVVRYSRATGRGTWPPARRRPGPPRRAGRGRAGWACRRWRNGWVCTWWISFGVCGGQTVTGWAMASGRRAVRVSQTPDRLRASVPPTRRMRVAG